MAKNNKRNIIVALVVLIGIAAIVVLILALTGVFGGKDTDAEDEQSTASSSTLVCNAIGGTDVYRGGGRNGEDIDILSWGIKNTFYFDDADTVAKIDFYWTFTTKSRDDAMALAEAFRNGTSTLTPFDWSASGNNTIGVLTGATEDLEIFRDTIGGKTSRDDIMQNYQPVRGAADDDYVASCN